MFESILNNPKIKMSMASEYRLKAWNECWVRGNDSGSYSVMINIKQHVTEIIATIEKACKHQTSFAHYRIFNEKYNPYAMRWIMDWLEWNHFIVKEVDCRKIDGSIILQIEW